MTAVANNESKDTVNMNLTQAITGMWQVSGRSEITDFDEVVLTT